MKISAIVSAYYAERYLDGRLENLLAQTPKPEVIVVCKVESQEHVIASKYDVRLVLTQNIPTIYDAWNMAITEATGEYITNANCDDRLYPFALAKLSEALDKHPQYSIAYSDCDIVDTIGGKPIGRYEWLEGDIEQLLAGCFLGPCPMWRKSLHDKHGMFDAEMHAAGDYEYWLRLSKAGEKFYHLKQATGAYLNRQDSAEHRTKLRSIWETARARGRYREGVGIWKKPKPMTE